MTDINTPPLAPPQEYDPDAERWVVETRAPHATAEQLTETLSQGPWTLPEDNPLDPGTTNYTPPEIIDQYVEPNKHNVGAVGIESLHTAYTNYTPATQYAGQVALNITDATARAQVGDNTARQYTPLRQGPGILVGFIYSIVTAGTSKIMTLVDSERGDGPVLGILNSATPASGIITLGHDGIQFNRGITLCNNPNDLVCIIPVIKREIPQHLGEK